MMTDQTLLEQFHVLNKAEKQQIIQLIKDMVKKKRFRQVEETAERTSKFGSAKGLFIIKEGFDDPLEDFKDYIP